MCVESKREPAFLVYSATFPILSYFTNRKNVFQKQAREVGWGGGAAF